MSCLFFPSKGAAGKFGHPLSNQDGCLAAVTELTNQVTAAGGPVGSQCIAAQHSDLLVRYARHLPLLNTPILLFVCPLWLVLDFG